MNLDGIPKTFWHALSLSVLILTLGFVYVSVMTGNLTLRFKDLEIITTKATTEAEAVKSELEAKLLGINDEIQGLRDAKENAEEALATARRQLDDFEHNLTNKSAADASDQIAALREQLVLAQVNTRPSRGPASVGAVSALEDFSQVQRRIDNLGEIQEQLQREAAK